MNFNLINKIARRVFQAVLTDIQKERVKKYTDLRKKGLSFGDKFKNERTYINIGKVNNSKLEAPVEIVDLLHKSDYSIVDYRKGIAQKYNKKLNKFTQKSIGKILNEIHSDDEIKKMFVNRLGTGKKDVQKVDFMVCITHKPQDVAGMSTGTNWTSCMRLPDDDLNEGGEYYYTALNQVQYGGMCAYLIDKDDRDIERPYARIAIKRLQNKLGDFIYLAQNTVYGQTDTASEVGFKEIVKKELEQSNWKTMNNGGVFKNTDLSSYSDTGLNKKIMINNENSFLNMDEDELFKYISSKPYSSQELCPYIQDYIEKKHPSKDFIQKTSRYIVFSIPFMEKYKDDIDWNFLSMNVSLDNEILQKFKDKLFWPDIFASGLYDLRKIEKYKSFLEKQHSFKIDFDLEKYVMNKLDIYDWGVYSDLVKEIEVKENNEDKFICSGIYSIDYYYLYHLQPSKLEEIPDTKKWLDQMVLKEAQDYIIYNKDKFDKTITPSYFLHDIYQNENDDLIDDWENNLSWQLGERYVDIVFYFEIIKKTYNYMMRTVLRIGDDWLYENSIIANNNEEVKQGIDKLIEQSIYKLPF